MRKSEQGFTLVELVMVIIVIGVLAAVTVPNWTGTSMSVEFEARRILNDVRYTQLMSMATGERYRFVRVSSSTYSITNEAGTAIVLPSGGTSVTLSGGVQFGTFSNLPNNLVAFDTQGAPYINTSLPGTALATTATITLVSGSDSRSITITPVTGYGAIV